MLPIVVLHRTRASQCRPFCTCTTLHIYHIQWKEVCVLILLCFVLSTQQIWLTDDKLVYTYFHVWIILPLYVHTIRCTYIHKVLNIRWPKHIYIATCKSDLQVQCQALLLLQEVHLFGEFISLFVVLAVMVLLLLPSQQQQQHHHLWNKPNLLFLMRAVQSRILWLQCQYILLAI